jgi:hypothetical protein
VPAGTDGLDVEFDAGRARVGLMTRAVAP